MQSCHRFRGSGLPRFWFLGRVLPLAFIGMLGASPAWSQTFMPQSVPPRVTREVDLSGPRFGFTLLSEGTVAALQERNVKVDSMVSQFGWQFERRLYTNGDGMTALMEWIPLVSGLE